MDKQYIMNDLPCDKRLSFVFLKKNRKYYKFENKYSTAQIKQFDEVLIKVD